VSEAAVRLLDRLLGIAVLRDAAVLHRGAEIPAGVRLELPPAVELPVIPDALPLLTLHGPSAARRAEEPPVEVGLVREREAEPTGRDRDRPPPELTVFAQCAEERLPELPGGIPGERHAHFRA